MPKIFDAVDEIIDRHLGTASVGSAAPHYRCIEAARALRRSPFGFSACSLLEEITAQLELNLRAKNARWFEKGASDQNWRWKKNTSLSQRVEVDEKTVEKLIAATCGSDWVNQVPTASGLVDSSGEKKCSIDLVHRIGEGEYEFIELKHRDSTPLFAAFEIVKYGMLFLLSMKWRRELGYAVARNPLLWASAVHLVVLAPPEFYRSYEMSWLQGELAEALASSTSYGLRMDFRYESMPWPNDRDARGAIEQRTPVYC